jgi:hypothetical protein
MFLASYLLLAALLLLQYLLLLASLHWLISLLLMVFPPVLAPAACPNVLVVSRPAVGTSVAVVNLL